MFNKITVKIVLFVDIFLLISLFLFIHFILSLERKRLIKELVNPNIHLNEYFRSNIASKMPELDNKEIDNLIEFIENYEDIDQIKLFNKDDKTGMVDIDNDEYENDNFQSKSELNLMPEEKVRILGSENGEKKVLGIVNNTSLEKWIEDRISRSRVWYIVISSGLIISLSFILIILINKYITSPIKNLSERVTNSFKEGDENYIQDNVPAEISELLNSINLLIRKIKNLNQNKNRFKKEFGEKFEKLTNELNKSREALSQAEKLVSIGRLACGLVHEVNNPLVGIMTSAYLLKDNFKNDNSIKDEVNIIINEANRCRKIVKELLEFARSSEFILAPEDINKIIEKSLFLASKQADFQKIEIVKKINYSLPKVMVDVNKIEQVFINILLNSFDVMPEGGIVTVSSDMVKGSEYVEISFTDTGTGIPDNYKSRIFEPFFTTKREGDGTGLGLAISENIIELHKGSISVESCLGVGAVFIIRLPIWNH